MLEAKVRALEGGKQNSPREPIGESEERGNSKYHRTTEITSTAEKLEERDTQRPKTDLIPRGG